MVMRRLLLTLILFYCWLSPVQADNTASTLQNGRQEYKPLTEHLACPVPHKLQRNDRTDTRVRLAVSGRLVTPPTEDAEELEQRERLSIFIGLRCLLD